MRTIMHARLFALGLLGIVAAAPAAEAQQQPLQGMWGSTGQYRGSTVRGGQMYSPDGRYMGQVQRPSGIPTSREGGFGRSTLNSLDNARRESDHNRPVYGANGQYLGTVNRDGQFYDSQGTYRGQMR
jgi:hypothetical protein